MAFEAFSLISENTKGGGGGLKVFVARLIHSNDSKRFAFVGLRLFVRLFGCLRKQVSLPVAI